LLKSPVEIHGIDPTYDDISYETGLYLGGGDQRNDGRKGIKGRRLGL
jgi:hypothetical protein